MIDIIIYAMISMYILYFIIKLAVKNAIKDAITESSEILGKEMKEAVKSGIREIEWNKNLFRDIRGLPGFRRLGLGMPFTQAPINSCCRKLSQSE